MSPLFNYIKNQWIMRRYNEAQIALCVTKNYITQLEADEILAMQQIAPPEEVSPDGA